MPLALAMAGGSQGACSTRGMGMGFSPGKKKILQWKARGEAAAGRQGKAAWPRSVLMYGMYLGLAFRTQQQAAKELNWTCEVLHFSLSVYF